MSSEDLATTSPEERMTNRQQSQTAENPGRARVFISYKRKSDPDARVARELFDAISRHHEVFIDRTILVGTDWSEKIEAELRRSDFLVTLLSERSVHSEMVQGEIEMAHDFRKEAGRPAILPVRLSYQQPF